MFGKLGTFSDNLYHILNPVLKYEGSLIENVLRTTESGKGYTRHLPAALLQTNDCL